MHSISVRNNEISAAGNIYDQNTIKIGTQICIIYRIII